MVLTRETNRHTIITACFDLTSNLIHMWIVKLQPGMPWNNLVIENAKKKKSKMILSECETGSLGVKTLMQ